ncbi:MAG: sigma-70 family RNA polymerase sigma factor [Bacteroidota bacterium]
MPRLPVTAPLPTKDPALAALCARVRNSDRAAFAALFRTLRIGLVRYVATFTGDAAAAHDVVQDVFVALWDMRAELDPRQPVRGLLFRMARNRALNHQRNRRRRRAKHDTMRRTADPTVEPVHRVDADRLATRLQAWLADLPDRQREAITLTRFEHLSHDQAAAVMGCAPRTVNNHIVRGLATIQARIDAFEASDRA